MHMIPGSPKVFYMFSCLRWCYGVSFVSYVGLLNFKFFCLLCQMQVFCVFCLCLLCHMWVFLFFVNVFYVIHGFFLLIELSTLVFYLCVFDIIYVPFFLLIFYIGLCVFYVSYGALNLNLLMSSILVSMCIF